jgi:hypothetical protein
MSDKPADATIQAWGRPRKARHRLLGTVEGALRSAALSRRAI